MIHGHDKNRSTVTTKRHAVTRNRYAVTKNRYAVTKNRYAVTRNRYAVTRNQYAVTRNQYAVTRNRSKIVHLSIPELKLRDCVDTGYGGVPHVARFITSGARRVTNTPTFRSGMK